MRSRVDFQKLDGDAEGNRNLMDKYSVTGFPRLVFTDNSGVALLNHRGAPDSADAFKEIIGRFTK